MVKSCVNVQVMLSLVQVTSKSRTSFEQVMFKLSASHFKVTQVKNFQVFVMKCSNCLSCQFFSSSWRLKGFSVLFLTNSLFFGPFHFYATVFIIKFIYRFYPLDGTRNHQSKNLFVIWSKKIVKSMSVKNWASSYWLTRLKSLSAFKMTRKTDITDNYYISWQRLENSWLV